MTRGKRAVVSVVLALLGPLPLPHVDSYLPLALGVGASVLAARENGPVFFLLMAAVLLVYAGLIYGVLSAIVHFRKARRTDS